MNNDLEQFSEERLKDIIELADNPTMTVLARIALSAKQAKPIGFVGKSYAMTYFMPPQDSGVEIDDLIYTIPQPAHTEQDGWIKCSERMPDDDSFVLVTNGRHTGMGAYLRDDHLEDDERWQDEHFEFINKQSKYSVTHWMKLPAAPKPESER